MSRYKALPYNNGSSTASFNTYKKNTSELNNLPSMEFATNSVGFRISNLVKNQYDYSLFIVESHNQLFSSTNKGALLYSSSFYIVYDWAFGSQLVDLSGITSAYMGNYLPRMSIHSIIGDPGTKILYYYLYRPKTTMYSFNSGVVSSIKPNIQQTINLDIGYRPSASYNFKGYISEIILFNRALKTSDRNLVEDYLMKKYKFEKT